MSVSDFDAIDYFRARGSVPGPVPVLRVPPRARPGVARAASWCGHDHGLRGSDGGLQRPRHVLVVQRGERAERAVPRPARGRRRQRAHRATPRRAAVQRPAAVVRSPEAHRPPRPPDATDHAEASGRERGVHVAARRSSDRRVRRPRCMRVHPRLREAVHAARHRRPARRAGDRPRDDSASELQGDRRPSRGEPAPARWRTSRWSSSTSGSPPTSKNAGANRATTS